MKELIVLANVKNTIDSVVVYGTNDADYIENGGSNVTVYGEAGNDSIENWGGIKNVLI